MTASICWEDLRKNSRKYKTRKQRTGYVMEMSEVVASDIQYMMNVGIQMNGDLHEVIPFENLGEIISALRSS